MLIMCVRTPHVCIGRKLPTNLHVHLWILKTGSVIRIDATEEEEVKTRRIYYKPSFWMQRALGLQSVTYVVVSQGCYIVCSGGSQTEPFCWEIKTTDLGNNSMATCQPVGPQWLILRCHHTCLLSVVHTSLYIALLGRKEANNNSWLAQTASRERVEPALQVRESSACHVRSESDLVVWIIGNCQKVMCELPWEITLVICLARSISLTVCTCSASSCLSVAC